MGPGGGILLAAAFFNRAAIDGSVPMFVFGAPVRGSGKSLLAKVVSVITTGRLPSMLSAPDDGEEMRKTLVSIGLAGDPYVVFDNVEGSFRSKHLSAAITAEMIQGRLLGVSKQVRMPFRAVLVVTGNNLAFRGDLVRRILLCDQDPQMQNPEDRAGFRYDPLLDHVRSKRRDLVVAALTVLKAHALAGRPREGARWGSFEPWDDVVRAALIWAGWTDPLETRERLREDMDEDVRAIREFHGAWFQAFHDMPQTAARAIQFAFSEQPEQSEGALANALAGLLPASYGLQRPSVKSLGSKLSTLRDRVVCGKKLVKHGKDRNGAILWAVIPAE